MDTGQGVERYFFVKKVHPEINIKNVIIRFGLINISYIQEIGFLQYAINYKTMFKYIQNYFIINFKAN